MAASINASTSGGVVTTADTSGNLNLQSNGTTIVALTSTGAAVTGTLSASAATGAFTGVQVGTGSTTNIGWILGNAASGLAGIWSTGVTPSATNYSIRDDGGTTLYLNASTNVITRIGNVGVIDVASTGLTVTGTMSVSGSAQYGPRANASSTGRVSVSTGATTLSTLSSGGSVGATVALFIVNGYNTGGSGNSFMDTVMFVAGASAVTLASINKGSPAARTYSASGSNFQLAMASGTYNVAVTQFEQSC
jgi:hypothetical protein